MKRTLVLAVVLACNVGVSADLDPVVHKFSLWGISSATSKLDLYMGFTNGLVSGAGAPLRSDDTPARQLLLCLLGQIRPSTSQAIAMIDKYYRENPEKWD